MVSFALAKGLGVSYLIGGIVTIIVSLLGFVGFGSAAAIAWALPAYFGLAMFLFLPAHPIVSAFVFAWCLLFMVGLWKGWRPIIYVMWLSYVLSIIVALLFSDSLMGLLLGIVQVSISGVLFFVIVGVRNKFIDENAL